MTSHYKVTVEEADDSLFALQFIGAQPVPSLPALKFETRKNVQKLELSEKNEEFSIDFSQSKDPLEKFALVLLDEDSKQLKIKEVPFFAGVTLKRKAVQKAADPQVELDTMAKRELLVKELGTKKNMKLLKNYQLRNNAESEANLPEISKLLTSSVSHVPDDQNGQPKNDRLAMLKMLLPPFAPSATQPKNIYSLGTLFETKFLEKIDVEQFKEALNGKQVNPVLSSLIARSGIDCDSKNQNWLKYFCLLNHALFLFKMKKIQQNLKELAKREGFDFTVLKELTTRYFTEDNKFFIATKIQKFRLLAFVIVLILLLFQFEFALEDIEVPLAVNTKELKILLRNVGCVPDTREGVVFYKLNKLKGI